MQVIPAIDVSQGRLARLDLGRRVAIDAFGGDPLEAARTFIEAGAGMVHVVDMDRAFDDPTTALELISEVAALGTQVQASGGITDAGQVSEVLDAGATRVVLGSGVLRDFDEVARLLGLFGERLVVGLETDGGSISPRGRRGEEPSETIELDVAVPAVTGLGASRLLLTQVARVGGMGGIDMATVERVMSLGGVVPLIVSGGAASIEELSGIRTAGIEAVVVGRALYEGNLDLAAAIRALS